MSIAERLGRPEILALPPVDIAGAPVPGTIRLDANENPYPALVQGQSGLNRYPDPQPADLARRMADLYGVDPGNLWVSRGSDDAIDLLIRAFCSAGRDTVAIVEPTFAAYAQFARIQGAKVVTTRLADGFNFDTVSRPAVQKARISRSMASSLPRDTHRLAGSTPYRSAIRRARSAGCGSG